MLAAKWLLQVALRRQPADHLLRDQLAAAVWEVVGALHDLHLQRARPRRRVVLRNSSLQLAQGRELVGLGWGWGAWAG